MTHEMAKVTTSLRHPQERATGLSVKPSLVGSGTVGHMAKGKRKNKKQTGPSQQSPNSEGALAEAAKLTEALAQDNADPALWGTLHKSLMAAKVPSSDVMPLIMGRDVEAVSHLLARLRGDEPAIEPVTEPTEQVADVPDQTKRQAMKAFRKRIKLTRLDHESRLGVGPLTGGKAAEFESILPPHQFPAEVWKALAADGQLVTTGRGFYKLP